MKLNRKIYGKTGKVLCFLLALILLFSETAVLAFAATVSAKKAAGKTVSNGVYRIRNYKTGLYVDSYDFIYETTGASYLSKKNSGEAQDVYIERQDDGTYTLTPQSENGTSAPHKTAISLRSSSERSVS